MAGATLAAVHFGTPWFMLLVALAVVLMSREWPELCLAGAGKRPLWRPRPPVVAVLFVVAALAAFVPAALGRPGIACVAALAGTVVVFAAGGGLDGPGRTLFALGVPYIVVPAAALLFLAGDPSHGRLTLYWLFAVVWATDSGGYVAGKLIGGPRLAPTVSPGKTWAGLAGGTVGASLAAAAFALGVAGAGPVKLAMAGVAVSLASQAGDLGESWVKRHFAVKDSGSIIPGHGGLFDRVDGLLAAAILVAGVVVAGDNAGFLWQ